jgi:hypothetical protein
METSEIYTNAKSIETVKEGSIDTLVLNFSGIKKNMQIQFIKY